MKKMRGVMKKGIALLLVLVMVSTAISPVMACGCTANSKGNKNAKVAVIEVKGMEKNKAFGKGFEGWGC